MRPLRTLVLLSLLAMISWAVGANETPTAAFSAYRPADAPAGTALFDASASFDSDGRIVRYQWVFGDGSTGSGLEVEHTFPRVDRYNVTLLATDDAGSWHMITKTIDLALLSARPSSTEAEAAAPQAAPASAPVGRGIGQRAPDFTLPTLAGDFVNLSDFLGRVVILDFWKSNCNGCRTTTPYLEALRKSYGDQGLVIVLISLDGSARDTQRYIAENGYTEFVVVRETRPITIGTVAAYDVRHTPTAFLIDRTGVIRYSGLPSGITAGILVPWL